MKGGPEDGVLAFLRGRVKGGGREKSGGVEVESGGKGVDEVVGRGRSFGGGGAMKDE